MPRPERRPFLLWIDAPFGARTLRLACAGSLDVPARGTIRDLLEQAAGASLARTAAPYADPTMERPTGHAHTAALDQGPHAGHAPQQVVSFGIACLGHGADAPAPSPWALAERWTERLVEDNPHLVVVAGPWAELPWRPDAPLLEEVRDVYSRLPSLARDPTRVPAMPHPLPSAHA